MTFQTAVPKDHGFNATKLDALLNSLAERGTKAFLVIRNDCIVHEWYLNDDVRNKGHYTASMAKALIGGVCLALGIDDGTITLDDPASKFIPQWANDPQKSKIAIRQLGTHTSGLDESKPKDRGGWQQDFWERKDVPNDPFTISRDITPVISEPGSTFYYSNPAIAVFGHAITAALGQDLRTALRDRVLRPIGVSDDDWSCGYGQTFEVDGLPLVAAWGGGGFTARAAAHLGRLMLRQGNWGGERILSANAVQQTTSDAGLPGGNGQGWWTNNRSAFPSMPRDAFYAAGAEHQTVLVVPSLDLICVRNGAALGQSALDGNDPRGPHLFAPLMDALSADHEGHEK